MFGLFQWRNFSSPEKCFHNIFCLLIAIPGRIKMIYWDKLISETFNDQHIFNQFQCSLSGVIVLDSMQLITTKYFWSVIAWLVFYIKLTSLESRKPFTTRICPNSTITFINHLLLSCPLVLFQLYTCFLSATILILLFIKTQDNWMLKTNQSETFLILYLIFSFKIICTDLIFTLNFTE